MTTCSVFKAWSSVSGCRTRTGNEPQLLRCILVAQCQEMEIMLVRIVYCITNVDSTASPGPLLKQTSGKSTVVDEMILKWSGKGLFTAILICAVSVPSGCQRSARDELSTSIDERTAAPVAGTPMQPMQPGLAKVPAILLQRLQSAGGIGAT